MTSPRYKITEANSVPEIETQVRELQEQGWQLRGELIVKESARTSSPFRFFQVLEK